VEFVCLVTSREPVHFDKHEPHQFNGLTRQKDIQMAKTTFQDLVPAAPAGRFDGIVRPYTPDDVVKLRGSVQVAQTLAERGANKLWGLLKNEPFINALGAVTGNQAMQMARAGLKAIYLSGWQVAADANTAGAMYPDQSLYPANAAPELCRRINRTLRRADEIETSEGNVTRDWFWWPPQQL
jgi:isocitrate lyase